MRSVKKWAMASEISVGETGGGEEEEDEVAAVFGAGHRRRRRSLMSTTGGGWSGPAEASMRSGWEEEVRVGGGGCWNGVESGGLDPAMAVGGGALS